MKTVKQIADEIGVTKQAVQKRISREPLLTSIKPYMSVKQGIKYINDEGERLIRVAFVPKKYMQAVVSSIDKGIYKDDLSIDKGIYRDDLSIDKGIYKDDLSIDKGVDKSNDVHVLIAVLQEQLKVKDTLISDQQKSICELTAALENTTASLHAAQALHAGTMKTQFITEQSGDKKDSETESFKPKKPRRNIFKRFFEREDN